MELKKLAIALLLEILDVKIKNAIKVTNNEKSTFATSLIFTKLIQSKLKTKLNL